MEVDRNRVHLANTLIYDIFDETCHPCIFIKLTVHFAVLVRNRLTAAIKRVPFERHTVLSAVNSSQLP